MSHRLKFGQTLSAWFLEVKEKKMPYRVTQLPKASFTTNITTTKTSLLKLGCDIDNFESNRITQWIVTVAHYSANGLLEPVGYAPRLTKSGRDMQCNRMTIKKFDSLLSTNNHPARACSSSGCHLAAPKLGPSVEKQKHFRCKNNSNRGFRPHRPKLPSTALGDLVCPNQVS